MTRPARPVRLALAVPAIAAALVAAGCGDDDGAGAGAGADAAVTVVATTTQVADLAREVGGDRVRVVGLLQPNTDPHDYEPRPQDVREAAEASLLLVSGGDLDEWAGDLAEQAGLEGDAVVDTGEGRPFEVEGGEHADEEEHSEEEGEEHSEVDPHWWHDPRNAEHAVGVIRDALARVDAEGAATYRANATSYTARIRAVDAAVAACLDAVPAEDRKLVTDHDAFGHLVARYDVAFVGAIIPATTSEAQPSARELSDLVATVRREKVRAIFPESSLNPALARTVAERTGAEVGETLYADTLGPEGEPGATYLGSVQANAETLVEGFTGRAASCAPAGAS